MVIIDKTEGEPWIYKRKPKPQNMTPKERSLYWGKEKQYLEEGYKGDDVCNPLSDQGIPGSLYYTGQHAVFMHRNAGQVIVPEVRLSSLLIHTNFHENKANNKHTGVVKARGVGLSAEGGSMATYHSIVYPGTNSLITSKEQKTIAQLFKAKIYDPFIRLDSDLISYKKNINGKLQHSNSMAPIQEVAKNMTQKESFLRLGVSFTDKMTGLMEYLESQLLFYETASTPIAATAFSGLGGIFGFFDELPLHIRKEALLHSTKECFRDAASGEYLGFLLWGGTCEDELSADDLAEFAKLIRNKELIDTEVLFLPYYMGKYLKNGHPDVARAKQWRDMEIEKAMKDPTGTALRKFIKNHPETLEEVLELGGSERWDEDVRAAIEKQKIDVINLNIPYVPVIFERDASGMMHHVVKRDSKTTMTEPPKQGVAYCCLIDGTSTGSNFGASDGSKLSAQIVKLADPSGREYDVVCEYLERPIKLDYAFKHIINMCEYYSQRSGRFEGIMAEAAQGMEEWMPTTLIAAGKEHWISQRNDLSGKGYTDVRKAFQPVNDKTKDFQYYQANIHFLRYIHGITRRSLLDELLRPDSDDGVCHSRSAYMMLFCKYPFINEIREVLKSKPKQTLITTFENGRMERKVVTINSSGSSGRGSQRLKFGQ